MAVALTNAKTKPGEGPSTGGGGFRPRPPRWTGGGGSGPGGDAFSAGERLKLAVWVGIAGIVMFFAAIASAMVVRRAGDGWLSLDLPEVVWFSTGVLLVSSATIELARRQLRGGSLGALRLWVSATAALGAAFLTGQYLGWSELFAQGVYMASSPASAFFYLLTAAHGAHLVGGLLAVSYITARAWSRSEWPGRSAAIAATAVYWHFMDVLWLALLGLLIWVG